jgi:hypothetical protein
MQSTQQSATASPSQQSKRKLIMIAAVLIVVVVVGVGVALSLRGSPPPSAPSTDTVTGVNWSFSGYWGAASESGIGEVSTGSAFTVSVSLQNQAVFTTYTVQSVSVSSPSGLTVVSTNTPLIVNAGTTQTLTVSLEFGGAGYDGGCRPFEHRID